MSEQFHLNATGAPTIRSLAVENLLHRLDNVKRSGAGWSARCPAHDDRANSLSVGTGADGRALIRCFAGCAPDAIVHALGLELRDLFPDRTRHGTGGGGPPPANHTATPQCSDAGLTLAQYAEAKRLPVDFLRQRGLSDLRYHGVPAVRIPYLAADGTETAVRVRTAMAKGDAGDARFRWRRGDKPALYGVWRLDQARQRGYVVLTEGESDAQTLWYQDEPALGIPGAASWREAWAAHLDGIATIYVVVEPDAGGAATQKWLAQSAIRDRVRLVNLDESKDPSGLYLDDPSAFAARWQAALTAAVPWSARAAAEAEAARASAWARCAALARESRILDCFAADLARAGVVGEECSAKLLYLIVTSRLLARPVSVAIKAPSSAGKSFLADRVLSFFPVEAYYALTAMSERALAYSDEPLAHRMLVIYEAAGMSGEFASYLVRSLLSEGRVRYETVEKTKDGLHARLIEREGPTGLIVTTTALRLHPENETRLLTLPVTDTPEQTRRVLLALAEDERPDVDVRRWQALQAWLATAEHRVTIPYARELAEAIPPMAVRLRRDFRALLNLISAHAILHQTTRARDAHGRIIATLHDYAVVRALVADLIAEGVDAAVPATIRETVAAVKTLGGDGPDARPIGMSEIAAELRLDKSAASRRVHAAIARGYLANLEDRRGRPARVVLGDPLPRETAMLPSVEELQRCRDAEEAPFPSVRTATLQRSNIGLNLTQGAASGTPAAAPHALRARVADHAARHGLPRVSLAPAFPHIAVGPGERSWSTFARTAPTEQLQAALAALAALDRDMGADRPHAPAESV